LAAKTVVADKKSKAAESKANVVFVNSEFVSF
jgi:hypothetical protein